MFLFFVNLKGRLLGLLGSPTSLAQGSRDKCS